MRYLPHNFQHKFSMSWGLGLILLLSFSSRSNAQEQPVPEALPKLFTLTHEKPWLKTTYEASEVVPDQWITSTLQLNSVQEIQPADVIMTAQLEPGTGEEVVNSAYEQLNSYPADIEPLTENENTLIEPAGGLIFKKESEVDGTSVESDCTGNLTEDFCSKEGIHLCGENGFGFPQGYVHEELAPVQNLWPRRWALAARRPVWPDVLYFEHVEGHAEYCEPLNPCGPVDMRALDHNLSPATWEGDKSLAHTRINIQPSKGPLPEDREAKTMELPALCHLPGISRGWCAQDKYWNASDLTHAPLYFEEANLERHGYSRGYWQPLVSGTQFFTTVPFLPGLMTIDPPNSVQYEIIEDRPGSLTPYAPRVPKWTTKAVLVELAAVTGLAFIIP